MRERAGHPPGRSVEPAPRSSTRLQAGTSPAAVAAELAGRIGNRALARVVGELQSARMLAREVRTILGERVHVRDDVEATEAEAIISTIETTYGIDVDALGTARVVRRDYPTAPAAVRSQVTSRRWRMRELRALLRACGHFAPILGAARATSSRHARRQEATRVGAVTTSITDDSTAVDPDTLGEFFAGPRTLALYRSGLSDRSQTGDVNKELEWTATHELAHGLMLYALPSFIRNHPFWLDRNTASGVAGAEAPPTDYGNTNAEEDMCEAIGMYFVQPRRLRRDAPRRFRWVRRKVAEWTARAPVAPVPAAAGGGGGHGPGGAPVPAGVQGGGR
jgi:hypothetical protein